MSVRYVHTNLITENWERLATFYETVFECVRVPPRRRQSGAWLSTGTGVPDAALEGMHLRLPGHGDDGPTLEIYEYSRMEPRPSPAANRKGYGHIAFRVDDVDETRAKVLANGGSEVGEVAETDVEGVGHLRFIYMADPDGNIIEIQSWSKSERPENQ